MILVITQIEDVHADFVIPKLNSLGIQVCRFHPDNYLSENNISYLYQDDFFWSFKGVNNEYIDFNKITSVYYRKPLPPKALENTVADMKEFSESESGYFINNFLGFLDTFPSIRWVNNYQKIRLAENKPFQLTIAKRLGLTIPKTLITNNPNLAHKFYLDNDRNIVLKALISKGLPFNKSFYTTRLRENLRKTDFDSVTTTATFFQEFIVKAYDIRIVVVDSDVYSVKIESQAMVESSIDFRATKPKNLKHSIIDLPASIKNCLIELVKSFGLVHAEIDMCFTKNGEYIFFEMNPNGQWLWLELQTGIKISDAFVDALISK